MLLYTQNEERTVNGHTAQENGVPANSVTVNAVYIIVTERFWKCFFDVYCMCDFKGIKHS